MKELAQPQRAAPLEKGPASSPALEIAARRRLLEDMVVPIMAAAIDCELPGIAERAIDPMCPEAVERRRHTRKLARAAFQLIPHFALSGCTGTPSPSGTELALDEAKRHVAILTAFWMDNAEWTKAANEARAFIAGVPEQEGVEAGQPERSEAPQ